MSTFDEQLRGLADSYGIATQFYSYTGEHVQVSTDTLLKTLHALGVDLAEHTEEAIEGAYRRREDARWSRLLPPCVVTKQGDQPRVDVHVDDGAPVEVWITCEDGSRREAFQVDNFNPPREVGGILRGEATFGLPEDLPLGWHRLHARSTGSEEVVDLIVTPRRLSTADAFVAQPASGVMVQVYSVRSSDSWGMGDFHDVATLADMVAREAGADFLLINPLHAAEPAPPVEDSPYLPTTRRFVNPLYLRIEDVPEYNHVTFTDAQREVFAQLKALSSSGGLIDRNRIYEAKLDALMQMFEGRLPEREAAFDAFVAHEGEGLELFARWCAATTGVDPVFYMWLQFLCDEQLAAAQAAAKDAGMRIGIIADLAVGVHPGGSDAHNLSAVLASEASVGAPPDGYNQLGQDWSQPPWHPVALAEAGYRPWRDMLRTVLKHAGGIRVDHVLGLFRLWWIPRMQPATTGTYVYYDHEALVGILALEAERAGAVVIGEDLGTFEPWVQDALAERGIMGTSILWFESEGDQPKHAGHYRPLALSSVTTHDLPPTTGFLAGTHIRLRDELGLFERPIEVEEAEDVAWQNRVLSQVAEYGFCPPLESDKRGQRGDTLELVAGLHRYVASTPSALACTSLVDMVGDVQAQNQPGTTKDMYPNWCQPLRDETGAVVLLEELTGHPWFSVIAAAGRRTNG